MTSADDAANGNHLVTITGRTHTDITDNLPLGNDFQFGVISADPGSDASNIGGIGMRAFTVDEVTGIRDSSGGSSVLDADVEGSKEISGGTSGTDFLVEGNGPPHVDELATFAFDGIFLADGASLELVLTKVKFDNKDSDPLGLRILMSVSVLGGGTVSDILLESLKDLAILTTDVDGNVTVHFDELFAATAGLNAGDNVESFSISALDDDVELGNLKGTAEHFLINSLSGTFVIPEPSSLLLSMFGLASLALWRRRPRA